MSHPDRVVLEQAKRVYMIGICGVGMTALAQVLHGTGKDVSGSDADEEFPTHAVLRRLHIPVSSGFDPEHIRDADIVIASSAYTAENAEVAEVFRRGIPLLRYDEALAAVTHSKRLIAITGTHGKTTTTAMIGRILEEGGLDPTVIVGAMVNDWGSNARVGNGEWMVVEADEYQEKFAALSPEILVITAIDWDHPDYFRDAESYRDAFRRRVRELPGQSLVVGYGDDADVLEVLHDGGKRSVTFGRRHHRSMQIIEESVQQESQVFWIREENGSRIGPFQLLVPGRHMASNAAAAVSVAVEIGVPLTAIRSALKGFRGAQRRMELVGQLPNGALVMDDYAHHPVEIAATLSAIRSRFGNRKVHVIFQAHTYSRTQALLEEFSHAFADADDVVITDIFSSAREKGGGDVTTEDLTNAVRQNHPSVRQIGFADLAQLVRTEATIDDLWVFMGAGDGWKVARELVQREEPGDYPSVALRNSHPDQRIGTAVAQIDLNRPIGQPLAQTVLAAPPDNPQVLQELRALVGEKQIEENVSLAKYTTFRIGGPARWLVHARQARDITGVAEFAQVHQIPLFVLSGGANVLVSDDGWPGIVIRCEDRSLRMEDTTVVAGSGVPLQFLATETAKNGLTGAEFLASIPGAVGGAIRGNAGAFGHEVKDIVRSIELWDGQGVRSLSAAECGFRYRGSAIKDHNREPNVPPWIILSATLELETGNPADSQERIKELLTKKASAQSLEKPSAGCLFKNIELTPDFWKEPMHQRWESRVPPAWRERGVIPAAWLVDHAELKGFRIGGVQVSTKHANYVVNAGSAKAEDVVMLISLIKQKIRTKYGVQLEEEVEMVGF